MAYMKFKGTYNHGLDAKKRMFIPAKYRAALGGMEGSFVICRAPMPLRVLYAFPEDTWEELCEELNEKYSQGELTSEQDWERRNLYRNADDVTMDSQGRITISPAMCDYAQLGSEVTIIGNMKRLEIWNPEVFAQAEAQSIADGAVGTPKLNF